MNSNYNFMNNRLGSLFNSEENDNGKSFGFLRWCKFLNLSLLFLLANFSLAKTVIGSDTETNTLNAVLCTPTTWYADADNDGFGNDEVTLQACDQPAGYVAVGGDCNDNNNTIYPGATEICYDGILQNCNGELTNDSCPEILSRIRPYFCGTTLQHVNSSILAAIPTGLPAGLAVTGYRYEITNLSTNEVRYVEKTFFMVRISDTNIAQFGTAYSIRVSVRINNEWQPFGLPCEINTPPIQTQIRPQFCGITLQYINSSILANSSINIPAGIKVGPGITGYRYEITNLSTNEVREVEKAITMVRISETNIAGFNTAYSIRVAVRVNGNWLSYGPSCVVNTPSIPTTIVGSTACGQALQSMQTTIFANKLTSVTGYEFEVSRMEGDVAVETTTIERSVNNFKLTQLSGIQLLNASEYQVRVRVKAYSGAEESWSQYGAVCSVFTPEAPVTTQVLKNSSQTNKSQMEFKAVAYPNPFTTSFAFDVRTSNTETVNLTVYDMAGRLLEVRELKADDVSNYQFGERYPSGVYNMVVTQGNETRTMRVVKQ